MQKIYSYCACFSLLILSGCFSEDEQVEPFDRGDIEVKTVEIGASYEDQVCFDLSRGEEVSRHSKLVWDFEIRADEAGGISLHLNSSKYMTAAKTTQTAFAGVISTDGLNFKWDRSSGHGSGAAMAEWRQESIYVIDLGFSVQGLPLGYRKVKFTELATGGIRLGYGLLEDTEMQGLEIAAPEAKESVYISLASGAEVQDIFPPAADWDLLFTQYTTSLFDGTDTISYLVTGALLNPSGVKALKDTLSEFAAIQIGTYSPESLTTDRDVIGYDWKWFDFDQSSYVIEPGFHYVVETSEGFAYKLRFTDFYNDLGERGAPQFEIQLL